MTKLIIGLMCAACAVPVCAQTYLTTPKYSWHRDSVTQAEFKATATSADRIVSNYKAQPGYFMPIEGEWNRKNDISGYPQLVTPDKLYTAVYNMGLDEMVNAVEADTTLRTGKEWAGVWTRDVSYSILLSMAYMQPLASRISLEKKVDRQGRIIQDTGSGGAWPVSSDRQIWTVAAWEVYKVTGDKKWLKYAYEVAKKSLLTDEQTIYDPATGLVRGETSFIDWREQSHPKWMQCADIYSTLTLSTGIVHTRAWEALSGMAAELGLKKQQAEYKKRAETISAAINKYLWMPDKGYYAMYLYGRDNQILNPRAETLGESLAIVWGIADKVRAVSITENNPVTPFGPGIFFPQIADMPPYHNNALWPWVDAWWTIANAKAGNEQGVLHGFGALVRPAALFCTNKENFVLDNGDIATELNSSNMLWCLAGNLALTHKVLFGINFEADGLHFSPFVPEVLGDTRSLNNFKYRDAVLNITVSGYGSKIKSFKVNGKEQAPVIAANKAKGILNIEIVMDSEPIPALAVNTIENAKSPITPYVRIDGDQLSWQSIEYINHYIVLRNGTPVAETRSTTYTVTEPGEYQVIGVSDDGIQSFASEPVSNRAAAVYEIPGETTKVQSAEIPEEYRPGTAVKGYTGNGFVELDKSSAPVDIVVNIPEAGEYFLTMRYANGNGPVNTENRCGIRTVSVDGNTVGIVVLPQRGRGNWDDWGVSNSLLLPHLLTGEHTVTIDYRPENENMNIDTNHFLLDNITLTKK
ncbi:MAG: hypothetical protein NC217_05785 [Muribaculaceae bacterium]|nr:hypothetical protein [Muribaculaceae bacterium]